jgi:methyl coenzyme M reductase beta subunit
MSTPLTVIIARFEGVRINFSSFSSTVSGSPISGMFDLLHLSRHGISIAAPQSQAVVALVVAGSLVHPEWELSLSADRHKYISSPSHDEGNGSIT